MISITEIARRELFFEWHKVDVSAKELMDRLIAEFEKIGFKVTWLKTEAYMKRLSEQQVTQKQPVKLFMTYASGSCASEKGSSKCDQDKRDAIKNAAKIIFDQRAKGLTRNITSNSVTDTTRTGWTKEKINSAEYTLETGVDGLKVRLNRATGEIQFEYVKNMNVTKDVREKIHALEYDIVLAFKGLVSKYMPEYEVRSSEKEKTYDDVETLIKLQKKTENQPSRTFVVKVDGSFDLHILDEEPWEISREYLVDVMKKVRALSGLSGRATFESRKVPWREILGEAGFEVIT